MIPLANKERELHVNKKAATFSKRNLNTLLIKIIIELEIIVIIQVNIDVLQKAYVI